MCWWINWSRNYRNKVEKSFLHKFSQPNMTLSVCLFCPAHRPKPKDMNFWSYNTQKRRISYHSKSWDQLVKNVLKWIYYQNWSKLLLINFDSIYKNSNRQARQSDSLYIIIQTLKYVLMFVFGGKYDQELLCYYYLTLHFDFQSSERIVWN